MNVYSADFLIAIAGVSVMVGVALGYFVGFLHGIAAKESCEPVSADDFRNGGCL